MSVAFQSLQAPVTNLGAGTTSLIAAPTSPQRIRVVAAYIVVNSATTNGPIQLKGSVSGLVTGPVTLLVGTPLVLPYNQDGWFLTQPGDALQIVIGGATISVSGNINYVTM